MLYINGEIITMEGGDFSNGYLLVRDGRIVEIGDMARCPSDSGEEVLDLLGKTMIPGLIDSHCHLGLWEDGLGFEGDDVNEDTDPSCPHIRALDGINPMDRYFEEAVAEGITSAVISPGSANPIGGEICAVKTYGRMIDRMVIKSPIAMKLALGENPKISYHPKTQPPVTRMATAAIIREQLNKAKRYMADMEAAEGDEDRELPEYDAKCEALIPLLRREIQAHIHAHKAYDIFTGIRLAEEFGLDYTIVHGTEGHLISDILSQLNARVICGPMICTRTKPELVNLTLDNCARLVNAGVTTAICTDHPEIPVGFLKMSAALAVSRGMEKRQALEAVTISAARACGIDDRVGSLKAGKDADFAVYDGDPLEAGREPVMVVIGGERVK